MFAMGTSTFVNTSSTTNAPTLESIQNSAEYFEYEKKDQEPLVDAIVIPESFRGKFMSVFESGPMRHASKCIYNTSMFNGIPVIVYDLSLIHI